MGGAGGRGPQAGDSCPNDQGHGGRGREQPYGQAKPHLPSSPDWCLRGRITLARGAAVRISAEENGTAGDTRSPFPLLAVVPVCSSAPCLRPFGPSVATAGR